jgi:hypothetical protein
VDQDCNGQISFKEYKDVMIKIIEWCVWYMWMRMSVFNNDKN